MIHAKNRLDFSRTIIGAFATIGLCCFASGCSGVSGLRSIAAERPSLFGFRDRDSSRAPSPTPDQDLYVQQMRSGQNAGGSLTPSSELATTNGKSGTDAASKPDPAAPKTEADPSAGVLLSTTETSNSVRLGRPVPMPTAPSPTTDSEKLAAGASGKWISEPAKNTRETGPPRQASETPVEVAAAPEPKPEAPKLDAATILADADKRLQSLKAYQVKISRVERVGGKTQPEEQVTLSIQREPKAVRLEWVDGPNKGREVIYSSAIDPRMIFVHMPTTPIPLPTVKIPVDSPLVMKNSRHAITEAGFDTILTNLSKSVKSPAPDSSGPDRLDYKGTVKVPGQDVLTHQFVRKTPAGDVWNVYLDSRTLMPRLVEAKDAQGELIERYTYHDVAENPADLMTAAAFSPDSRWGEPKGLLGRIARNAAGDTPGNTSQMITR